MSHVNNAKVLFSVPEDEKLVECVSQYPCLYDLGDPLNKNRKLKDKSWKEVAENVERSKEDCKKRWKNIKDTYQRRQKKGTGTGSSSSNQNQWLLAETLSTFLDEVETKRLVSSTTKVENDELPNEEDDEEEDEEEEEEEIKKPVPVSPKKTTSKPKKSTASPAKSANKRRKFSESVQPIEEKHEERPADLKEFGTIHDDDVDLFFKSLALSVKKLKPELQNEAKIKTLQVVIDLQRR